MSSLESFRLMKMVRDNLCDTGSLSIGKTLETHIKKYFLNVLFQFHADFVECLAYGCFTELNIGYDFSILHDNMTRQIDRNYCKFTCFHSALSVHIFQLLFSIYLSIFFNVC